MSSLNNAPQKSILAPGLKRPLAIALLGRSGAGKGTQSSMLLSYLHNPLYIVTGDLFRELAVTKTVVGRKVSYVLHNGILPPEWLAQILWQRALTEKLIDPNQDIILDGAPRRVEEAIAIDETLKWLERPQAIPVLFDITREEAFQRLEKRGRADDRDDNINKRLDWYEAIVLPVVRYYESSGRLVRVDGMPAEDQVFQNLLAALDLTQ